MPIFEFESLEEKKQKEPEPKKSSKKQTKAKPLIDQQKQFGENNPKSSNEIITLETKIANQQFTIDYLKIALEQMEQKLNSLVLGPNTNDIEEQNTENKTPELYEWVEEIANYIKKHNVKSFNANDPKFRTTQIEKILTIIKTQYKGKII